MRFFQNVLFNEDFGQKNCPKEQKAFTYFSEIELEHLCKSHNCRENTAAD